MPRILFYVKGDQAGWESSYCVSQVLKPLFGAREALGPAWADIAVQCARSEADYYELELVMPENAREWVRKATYWKGTRRFRLAQVGGVDELTDTLHAATGGDMPSPVAIREFLGWGFGASPPSAAGTTALVLWGHGGAWRVSFLARIIEGAQLNLGAMLEGFRKVVALDGADKVSRVRIGAKVLRGLPDLADGLRWGLSDATGGGRLGVLAFNSCFMSCVEVAYELREYAELLVGSEEETPFVGWDHAGWLADFHQDPQAGAESLARMMVNSFGAQAKPGTTISAIRLGAVASLVEAIAAFVSAARALERANWQGIRDARAGMREYGRYLGSMDVLMVDIVLFFERVGERCPQLREAALRVTRACRAAICCAERAPDRAGSYGSHGISIFFPASRQEFNRLAYAGRYNAGDPQTPSFIADSGWRAFLDDYWGLSMDAE